MSKKAKMHYNLYVSLGEACSSSATLRNSKLQYFSYPFDWVYGSTFMGRVDILCSDFEKYIDFDELEHVGYKVDSQPTDFYRNKYNDITFNHDFPLGVTLKKSYKEVKEKYDRRISRVLSDIKNSPKVLFLYKEAVLSKKPLDKNELLFEAYDKLSKKFPNKKIDLLYMVNDETLKQDEVLSEDLSENIKKIRLNYVTKKKSGDDPIVDNKALKKFFKSYKLKMPLKFFIKQKLYSFIKVRILKKGIGVYIFSNITNNIFRLNLLVLGLKLDLCIGKMKKL